MREGDATGAVGGSGGGRVVMTVANTGAGREVGKGAGGSRRTGEGETSSRTPEEEEEEEEEEEDEDEDDEEEEEVTLPPASAWSGDIAPSLLDSSSYCT